MPVKSSPPRSVPALCPAPRPQPAAAPAFVRALLLAASLGAGPVLADDYSDVGQLLREGRLIEAQARVERYLAVKPRDVQMRFYRGLIQRESGRTAEAIATFTRLAEDHPELPEPHNNLAVLYAAQGQYDKARVALEKALRTHPSYATAHDNLGDIYARLASQAYSKALQLDGNVAPPPVKLALIRELSDKPGNLPAVQRAAAPVPPQPAGKPVAAAAPAAGKPAVVATAPAAASVAAPAAQPVPAARPAPATPVPAAAPTIAARTPDAEQAVRAWAKAWADKNMSQYLAAYGKDFQTPGNLSRSAWEDERRLRIVSKSRITVNLLDLQVTVTGNRAVAKFRQDYKADSLAIVSRKTLELVKAGDRWVIVREYSGS